jgi:trk system potassium uptake protein
MLQVRLICKTLSFIVFMFAFAMLPPLLLAWWSGDGMVFVFIKFIACNLGLALFFNLLSFRCYKADLSLHSGILLVILTWCVLGSLSALPFAWHGASWMDAWFEGVSGLTTTGAEALLGLDHWPISLRFYHQWLEWLGGMGVIILAMAVLPMLGVGGMQLYRMDIPGPSKDNKISPRIRSTAENLWMLYIGLTISCLLCYKACGLPWFDAIAESLTTVSTGGFSIHDMSFHFYHNRIFQAVAMVFMILGSLRFGLHYRFMQEWLPSIYWKDAETVAFFRLLIVMFLLLVSILLLAEHGHHLASVSSLAIFSLVSVMTTTGFKVADFSLWPSFLPVLLLMLALIGGCVGSTSGGLKMFRAMLIREEIKRSLKNMVHPNAVFAIHMGETFVSESVLQSLRGFVLAFFMIYFLLNMALFGTGMSLGDAFAGVTSCLTNLGVSIGGIANHYTHLANSSKFVLMLAMLAGRMEIMTFLILFMPSFWRRY